MRFFRRRPIDHRNLRALLGLLLFVAGILLLLVAVPHWFWLTLLGIAAAWRGWLEFSNYR